MRYRPHAISSVDRPETGRMRTITAAAPPELAGVERTTRPEEDRLEIEHIDDK